MINKCIYCVGIEGSSADDIEKKIIEMWGGLNVSECQ
jgi:hypothetical protein